MAYVYILQSEKNDQYYVGATKNLRSKVKQHLQGQNKSTKCLLPLKIKLYQHYQTYNQARIIENKLKKLKRKDYLDKIVKEGVIKMGP